MIYFIQSLDTIKIGYTKNLDVRVKALQTSNPHGLIVIGTVNGNENGEKAIHKELDKYRLKGEWFKNCDEVRTCIDKILKGDFVFKYDRLILRKDPFGEYIPERVTIKLGEPKILDMWREHNSRKTCVLHGITKELKEVQVEINMLLARKQRLEKKYIKSVKGK